MADKTKTATNVKDPVCGMELDPEKVEFTSNRTGKIYYFCSDSCKEKFDENASLYAA